MEWCCLTLTRSWCPAVDTAGRRGNPSSVLKKDMPWISGHDQTPQNRASRVSFQPSCIMQVHVSTSSHAPTVHVRVCTSGLASSKTTYKVISLVQLHPFLWPRHYVWQLDKWSSLKQALSLLNLSKLCKFSYLKDYSYLPPNSSDCCLLNTKWHFQSQNSSRTGRALVVF